MNSRVAGLTFLVCLLPYSVSSAAAETAVTHALAMHGEPKYGPEFKHFEYVNPDAPKGGDVRLHAIGTFDTLNPFNLRGVKAVGLGGLYDTLLTGSEDEAFTEYGLLAETVEVPEDRSWVAFTLRKEARWHDGRPVTVEDVIYSLETLKTKGHPFYRAYYASVAAAEAAGERRVKFTFAEGENRELPLIVGQLPVIPKHYWEGRDFTFPSGAAPTGSKRSIRGAPSPMIWSRTTGEGTCPSTVDGTTSSASGTTTTETLPSPSKLSRGGDTTSVRRTSPSSGPRDMTSPPCGRDSS